MAHCVYSAVLDTDEEPMRAATACVVHTTWEPCPNDGQPAAPLPLHSFDSCGERRAVASWRRKTHGQRPLILHHGSPTDPTEHVVPAATATDPAACPCRPTVHPAAECPCTTAPLNGGPR